MNDLATGVFRLLLLLLPRSFRHEHGAESVALFRRTVADARVRRGRVAAARTAWNGWRGVVSGAAEEWAAAGARRASGTRAALNQGWGMGVGNAIHQAVRSITRACGLSGGIVALMTLGLGTTLTVLAVIDGALVRHLPYPEPDRLAVIGEGAHAWPDIQDWQRTVQAFETLAAVSRQTFTLTADGPRNIAGARISEGLLGLLGARVARGRLPSPAEYRRGSRVAVIGHEAWARRWGGDEDLVGRSISVDGAPLEVIGILDGEFRAPEALTGRGVDLWVPVDPAASDLTRRDRSFHVLGRLAPSATLSDAATELRQRAVVFAQEFPGYAKDDGTPRRTFPPEALADATSGDARAPLLVLLSGAALLLLVACGNAGSLLVARGQARRGELALRSALGGGPGAILSQLLAEAVMLALAGGILALAVAFLGVEGVKAFEPGHLPRAQDIRIDAVLVLAAFGLSLTAGVAAGLVPAWRGMRAAPAAVLRRAEGGTRGGMRGGGGRWLVAAQTALASLLLLGALTVVRTLATLTSLDPGFVAVGTYVVEIDMGRDVPAKQRGTDAERIRERLAALPRVSEAGAGVTVPFQISGGNRCCWVGELANSDRRIDRPWVHPVVAGYFEALGMEFLSGRGFHPRDRSDGLVPVVLNHVAAEELFPGGEAVGGSLRFASIDLGVVGVLSDVRHWGADEPIEPEFYLPYAPRGTWASGLTFVLRSPVRPSLDAVRLAVNEVAPRAVVGEVLSMTEVMGASWARYRFYTVILGFFATASLVLACAGLTGTLLYDARSRRHELVVRMALGASPGRLVGGVVGRSLGMLGSGATLGLLLFWPLHRFLRGIVPGVDSTDPGALLGFVLVLAIGALVAAWAPARVIHATEPRRALG